MCVEYKHLVSPISWILCYQEYLKFLAGCELYLDEIFEYSEANLEFDLLNEDYQLVSNLLLFPFSPTLQQLDSPAEIEVHIPEIERHVRQDAQPMKALNFLHLLALSYQLSKES